MKRISTPAYQALRDALPAFTWYKKPFETFLRAALRDHPELLGLLNFGETKRSVADALVNQLLSDENRYQTVTLELMADLAALTQFPDIDKLQEPDRAKRLGDAQIAIANLKDVTKDYFGLQEESRRVAAETEARRAQGEALRAFDDDVAELKTKFLALRASESPQRRGYALESLLSDLFVLFDMEPRLAYSTATEQIDGSLTFDTDDYIVEAKWVSGTIGRDVGDVFAAKVHRRGKNALGLLVAVDGFSAPLREAYSNSTPFITMDGSDLFLVLDGRVRLDDLLKAKRRHANETGACYLPAASAFSSI